MKSNTCAVVLMIMLLCQAPAWAGNIPDSVAVMNRAVNQVCTTNPDKASCERMVWMSAKVTMMNTSFYMQNCRDKKKITAANTQPCQSIGRLLEHLNTVN